MGERVSLSKVRAFRANDTSKWTAVELLEDLLEQVKSGQINPKQIAVHWFENADKPELIGPHDYILAKCNIAEHMMLLEVGKQKMIDLLRG